MMDAPALFALWIGAVLACVGLPIAGGLAFKRLFAHELAEHARQADEMREVTRLLNDASDRRCVRDTLTALYKAGAPEPTERRAVIRVVESVAREG